MAVIYPFMQGLRESPFPAPGKTVTIKSFIPESGTEVGCGDSALSVLLQRGAASMGLGWAVRTLCPGGQRCHLPWVRAVVRMEPTCERCHFAAPSARSPRCKTSPDTIPEHRCSNSLSVSTAVLGLCWFTPLPQGCNPAVQAAARPLHRLSRAPKARWRHAASPAPTCSAAQKDLSRARCPPRPCKAQGQVSTSTACSVFPFLLR